MSRDPLSRPSATTDARRLYKALDELLETLHALGLEGTQGDLDEYDAARDEAEGVLTALEAYADAPSRSEQT